MLKRVKLAGAPDAALDLIDQQQQVALVAKPPQPEQELRRAGIDAAFALDRFDRAANFLGGFGMMDLGWCHPDVIAAVKAQLERSPMPSQELIDPLRGVLAKLMATITPGKPAPLPASSRRIGRAPACRRNAGTIARQSRR